MTCVPLWKLLMLEVCRLRHFDSVSQNLSSAVGSCGLRAN